MLASAGQLCRRQLLAWAGRPAPAERKGGPAGAFIGDDL